MSRFQDVRGRLEQVTADALAAAGITAVGFDNVQEDFDELPFASMTLSFTGTIALSLGCVADKLEGSVAVTVVTPRRQGSTAGEDACQRVLQAWADLNRDYASAVRIRTRNHQGPVSLAPGTDPHHVHTLNCGFSASVAA